MIANRSVREVPLIGSADRSWLMREPERSLPLRLFCFPHAGAGAGTYRSWLEPLGSVGVAVCPVQLPGRENRFGEPLYDRIDPLVGQLVAALAPYLDSPFALFGHSMGALLAFALARALRSRSLSMPVQLHVSGRIAPHLTNPRQRLHDASESELLAVLRTLGGVPQAVLEYRELMRFQLPVLRADLAINETYRFVPEPSLDVPITAWCGDADAVTSEPEVEAWALHTRSHFRVRVLPGGHFFVTSAQQLLLRYLIADLRAGNRDLADWHRTASCAA